MRINIAIDGPCAAGKSSIAEALAHKLGYIHLDTGAMYRTVAYLALKNQIALTDEQALLALLRKTKIEFRSNNQVIVADTDVSEAIRANEISMASSTVSKHKAVREYLVAWQRKIAQTKGYILDGRDIGTVVLKDAEVKIFLTASAAERAKRRIAQNRELGIPADYEAILKDINQRDYEDTHRQYSPLRQAEDAIVVDTSFLTLDEAVEKIMKLIRTKI